MQCQLLYSEYQPIARLSTLPSIVPSCLPSPGAGPGYVHDSPWQEKRHSLPQLQCLLLAHWVCLFHKLCILHNIIDVFLEEAHICKKHETYHNISNWTGH